MTELHSDEAAPRVFECNIDRSQTKMPDDYLPEAPGILIAGEDMLRAAGYIQGSYRPRGWKPAEAGTFRRRPSPNSHNTLWVRKCGKFWLVERSIDLDFGQRRDIEALVFALPTVPICTRTYQAAMRLAEFCDPMPRPPVAGYWEKVCVVRSSNGLLVCTRH